jgi:hypothetical protein
MVIGAGHATRQFIGITRVIMHRITVHIIGTTLFI